MAMPLGMPTAMAILRPPMLPAITALATVFVHTAIKIAVAASDIVICAPARRAIESVSASTSAMPEAA